MFVRVRVRVCMCVGAGARVHVCVEVCVRARAERRVCDASTALQQAATFAVASRRIASHSAATFAVATRRRAVQHDPLRRIRDGRCAPEDVQREKARQLESWDRWVAEQVTRTFKRGSGAKRDPPLGAAAVLSGTPHYEARWC